MTTRSEQGLAARTLRLSDIPGTVRVLPGDGPGMAFELTGPARLTDSVTWKILGDVLHISGPAGGGGVSVMTNVFGPGGHSMSVRAGRGIVVGDGDVFVSGRGQTVVSSGRQTVISTGGRGGTVIVDGKVVSGGDGEPGEAGELELTVHVPSGSPVQISDDGDGNYELGATGGPLDLKLGGANRVRAVTAETARVHIGGHSEVILGSVSRSLHIDISGSGTVQARQGSVGQLRVSVSGSGQVAFGGTAASADLSVSGSGRVRADTVTGTLRRNVSGSGSIDVRVQPARSADDFWD